MTTPDRDLHDAPNADALHMPLDAPESPEDMLVRASTEARATRRRIGAIFVGTVLAHAALFAGLASITPKAPPAPREVEVMTFEAVTLPGGAASMWQGEGGRRVARIRPDPATYAR